MAGRSKKYIVLVHGVGYSVTRFAKIRKKYFAILGVLIRAEEAKLSSPHIEVIK